MVDKAYLSLLTRVTHGDRAIPAALRESLLTYFADLDGALRGALTPKELRKARQGIELLRRLPTDGPKASLPDPF